MQNIVVQQQDETKDGLRKYVGQPVQQHQQTSVCGVVLDHATVLQNEIQRVRAPDQNSQPQQSLHHPLLVLAGVGIISMLQHALANDVQSKQEKSHRNTEALPSVRVCRVPSHVPDSNHKNISHQQSECVPHIDASNQSKIQQQQRSSDQPIQVPQPPKLMVDRSGNAVSLGHEEIKSGSNDGDGRSDQPVPLALGPAFVGRVRSRIAEHEDQRADHEYGENHPTGGFFTCRQCEHGSSCVNCQS
mmetsp:Transcript_37661/g.90446  ORF Transcript_37661/g.90446 Transcript_37661/m.90446 type:complete len:245 (+) Transcript_37661:142-876(+)